MSHPCCDEPQHLEAPPGCAANPNDDSIPDDKLPYDEVVSLKKRQRTLRIQISTLHNKWSQGNPIDLSKLQSISDQLDEIHTKLGATIEYDVDFVEAEEQFEKYSRKVREIFANRLNPPNLPNEASNYQTTSSPSYPGQVPPSPSSYRRETIVLPVFTGQQRDYYKFRQTWMCTIHNADLPKTEKFLHVVQKLSGPEFDKYHMVTPSDQAYDELVADLESTYLDPKHQQSFILREVESLPILKRFNDAAAVHKFTCLVASIYQRAKLTGLPIDYVQYYLLRQILARCPPSFQEEAVKANVATFDDLLIELKKYVSQLRDLEQIRALAPSSSTSNSATHGNKSNRNNANQLTRVNVVAQTSDQPKPRQFSPCAFCAEQHLHKDCSLSVDQKLKVVTDKQLCRICLRPGHHAATCSRRQHKTCRWCHRSGHSPFLCKQPAAADHTNATLLISDSATTQPTSAEQTIEHAGPPDDATHVRSSNVNSPLCLYKTLIARINGRPVRMLIDEASGRSFITASLVKKLGLKPETVRPLPIAVFMQDRAISAADSIVRTTLSNLENSFTTAFNPRVVPSIGIGSFGCINDDMRSELSRHGISHHDTADQPVEVIIGIHRAINLETAEPKIDLSGNFTAAKTAIGWVVYGGYDEDHDDVADTSLSEVVCSTFLINMEQLYREMEDTSSDTIVSDVVKDFSTRIEFDGERFTVPLPWLHPVRLNCNRNIAHRRLQVTLSSLKRRDLLETYNAQMQELIDNGFVEPVTSSMQPGAVVNYLPHHAIFRPDKETTQIRLVFDGSAKNTQRQDLNSNLAKGATSWNLFHSMLDVRMNRWAVTADITKAFLAVGIVPSDRDALRFLWIDQHGDIVTYRFKRVPFGTSASPFLLHCAMQVLFDRCTIERQFVDLIRDRFYVDDLCISIEDEDQLSPLKSGCERILQTGGMILRKFRTNHTIDRDWCPDGRNDIKILGTVWNVRADTLSPPARTYDTACCNKRELSSILASFYDPLGIALPFYLRFKFALQDAWLECCDWNSPLPINVQRQVSSDLSLATALPDISITRWIGCSSSNSTVLHLFVDASQRALGAVLYAAQPQLNRSAFVCSKNKLVKPKSSTIPTLELKSLQMGVELLELVTNRLNLTNCIIWTDSMITFHRLQKPLNSIDAKVAPHVWSIRKKLSNLQFEIKHVRTESNPADLLTRGCDPTRLMEDDWRIGPSFIRDYDSNAISVFITASSTQDDLVPSHLEQLLRSGTAAFATFESNVQGDNEFDKLLKLLIASQTVWYGPERDAIRQRQMVGPNSSLRNYQLFIGDDNLLRIFSRLARNEDLSYDRRFPVVLAPDCSLTRALILETHIFNGHSSIAATDHFLLERYFIIGHRRLIKKTIQSCDQCRIVKGNQLQISLAPLPAWKSSVPLRPFIHTFVDFFGPIQVKTVPPQRFYGIIFVCGHTRAIHLELLQGQDTESCLLALRLFCARRGTPHHIYSDSGPGLKRSQSVLHEYFNNLKKLAADSETVRRGVKWHFASVYSPWKLGQHERLIRTVKDTLRGITFSKRFSKSQLMAILAETEQIVNSRPLYRNEEDLIITPADYLGIGAHSNLPPLSPSATIKSPELLNIKRIHRRLNGLWSHWFSSYLTQGPNIYKNPIGPDAPLKVGDIVLLDDAKRDRADWPLGKIIKVYSSGDTFPRSADIRLSSGRILENRSTRRMLRIPGPPDDPSPLQDLTPPPPGMLRVATAT